MIIKAILKEPHKEPEVIEIDNKFSKISEYLGGMTQEVLLSSDILILADADGYLHNLEPNFDFYIPNDVEPSMLVGKALFVKDQGHDYMSLSDDDIDVVIDFLSKTNCY